MNSDLVYQKLIGKRVLVIGDVMLDKTIRYKTVRRANEFDGDILREEDRTFYPGGAANVAKNCRALQAQVTLLGAFGTDLHGRHLAGALTSAGIDVPTMAWNSRPWWGTTTKTRVCIDGKPDHRVDADCHQELGLAATLAVIKNKPFDLLLLSDYQKGIFRDPVFVRQVIDTFRTANPQGLITANPKPELVMILPPVDLISVNHVEYQQAFRYLSGKNAPWLLHTQGRDGVTVILWDQEFSSTVQHFLGSGVANADVVGCGDAVFAAASLALTVYPDISFLGKTCIAAGTAKARLTGTQPVELALLMDEYRRIEHDE
jgi:bifunctional ADP-heptose synthase (sugar kinase/adenylyltransferase)